MPKKRILNLTSEKHSDAMVFARKTDALSPDVTLAPYVMSSSAGLNHIFGWIATARDNTPIPGVPAGPIDKSSRTSTTCFMRGLKERILIESQTSAAFVWRRIVFSFTGQEIVRDRTSDDVAQLFDEVAPQGYLRVATAIQVGTTAPVPFLRQNLTELIFRGVEGLDWRDPITAPLDTSRITVLSDQRTNFQSGNEQGILRRISKWYPFNKNLVYNDDENAGGRNVSSYSANTRASMGDVYVIDCFSLANSVTPGTVAFSADSTLYWHEK